MLVVGLNTWFWCFIGDGFAFEAMKLVCAAKRRSDINF
jgi:hypothetical protein